MNDRRCFAAWAGYLVHGAGAGSIVSTVHAIAAGYGSGKTMGISVMIRTMDYLSGMLPVRSLPVLALTVERTMKARKHSAQKEILTSRKPC